MTPAQVKHTRRDPSAAVLWALAAFTALAEFLWLALDRLPPRWDDALHLSAALRFTHVLRFDPLSLPGQILSSDSYYPPLVPLVGGFFGLFLPTADGITASMALFLALGLYSIFRLSPEAKNAWVAPALFAVFPLVSGEGHYFMLDLPLAAWTALGLWRLRETDGFRHRNNSLIFGAVFGAGMLVKWTFPVFVLAPLVRTLPRRSKNVGAGTGRHVLYALGAALVVAGPWYVRNFTDLVIQGVANGIQKAAVEGLPGAGSLGSFLYYFRLLPDALTWPLTLLLAVTALLALRDPKGRSLLWDALVAVLLLSLIPNKKDRYLMPVLPLFALLISTLPARLPLLRKEGVRWATGVLGVGALMQVFLAWAPLPFPWPYSYRPIPQDWKCAAFLDQLPKDREVSLSVVPDAPHLNNATMAYTVTERSSPVRIQGIYNFPLFAEYVLAKTGDQGPAFSNAGRRAELTDLLLDPASVEGSAFERVFESSLPDGSRGLLFKRRGDLKVGDEALKRRLAPLLDKYLRKTKGFRLTVKDEGGGAKTLEASFDSGWVGDYAYKDLGLRVRDARLRIRGLRVNPASFAKGTPQLMDVQGVELTSLAVGTGDLGLFIASSAKELQQIHVEMDGGRIVVEAFYRKIPLRAVLRLWNPSTTDSNLFFKVEELRAGRVPLPAFLVNLLARGYNPLLRRAQVPLDVSFGEVTCEKGMLRIGRP